MSADTGQGTFVLPSGEEVVEYNLPSPTILFRAKAVGHITVSVMGFYPEIIGTGQTGDQCDITMLSAGP